MAIDWNYYGLERFTEEMPYELGYVEKLLDKTLRKYGEKLSGFDNTNFYEAKTEEIGKRVCHITSERFVLPIGEKTDSVEESTIIYYRSVPILNLAEDEFYSREMLKKFLPYRDTSTIEHIGIKSKDSDTEMVITFDGRDKDDNCKPYMRGYVSERVFSKPEKELTYQGEMKPTTRKFFVDAFNNYFDTSFKYEEFSRNFNILPFGELNRNRFSGSECIIARSSRLLIDLYDARSKISQNDNERFKTDEFIDMIVDYIEK